MQTNPVTEAALPASTEISSIQKNTEVSSDMFLNLLVTQLKNQDPLSPTDNTAFVAQLAQFSSLEGINNLNSSFAGVSDSMDALSNFGMAGLIGKNATVKGSSFVFKGTPRALGYELKEPADSVTLTVYDSAGKAVGTMTQKNVAAGSHDFVWDGKGADGNALPGGTYDFTVTAGQGDGPGEGLETFISGTVDGVDFSGTEPMLAIGGVMYGADGLKEIF
jgi:flagellar basal-body rod modification protein FlgD